VQSSSSTAHYSATHDFFSKTNQNLQLFCKIRTPALLKSIPWNVIELYKRKEDGKERSRGIAWSKEHNYAQNLRLILHGHLKKRHFSQPYIAQIVFANLECFGLRNVVTTRSCLLVSSDQKTLTFDIEFNTVPGMHWKCLTAIHSVAQPDENSCHRGQSLPFVRPAHAFLNAKPSFSVISFYPKPWFQNPPKCFSKQSGKPATLKNIKQFGLAACYK